MFDDKSIAGLLQYSKSSEGHSKFEKIKTDNLDLLDISKFDGYVYRPGTINDSQANTSKYIFDTASLLGNMNILDIDYYTFKNTSNKLYKLYHIQPPSQKQKLTINLSGFINFNNNQYFTDLSNANNQYIYNLSNEIR